MSSASPNGMRRRTQMLDELDSPVNGPSRMSSTSSMNSWRPVFSFSRSFSTPFGGFGSLVSDSAFTFGLLPVIELTWLFDALLVWLTAKNRKLSVTNEQVMIDAQRTSEP